MGPAENIDAVDLVKMKPAQQLPQMAGSGRARQLLPKPLRAQGNAPRLWLPYIFDRCHGSRVRYASGSKQLHDRFNWQIRRLYCQH
jgi:hypothetical protein